jgi:pseudaminic acid synthase
MIKFINKKPFFIAEISANHCGSLERAKKLIKLAKYSGADAVKIQTYTPDMMTLKKKFIIKKGLWKNVDLWNLYEKAQTPLNWHKTLFGYAKKLNIKIFSTPFSPYAVDFLEDIGCKAYKISSFEMNDLHLIRKTALTKKPMIISTGLATIKEIDKSFNTAIKYGCKDITLLYCVSNYPSNILDFNLNNIKILKTKFKCKIGLSDHSIGDEIAKLAIAMGAEVFEKHIALQNQNKGHDIKFSAKGVEVARYNKSLNQTFNLFKRKTFFRSKNEMQNSIFRRSIYAIENIKKGQKFTTSNIVTLRPNLGLGANYYPNLLGEKSPINISRNQVLKKKLKNFINLKKIK